ncbi:NAD-dependent epimerase/dehydratase family protein [Myxococcota bacterium]
MEIRASRFWDGKRVFITGANGFVGQHLARVLVSAGARVIGFDRSEGTPGERGATTQGTLDDAASLRTVLEQTKPEVLFHLAALPLVADRTASAIPVFETNVRGTWNLLESARGVEGISAIVMASTLRVYGRDTGAVDESAPLLPSDVYDVSKACADFVALSYHRMCGVPVAVLRLSNVYGPGDSHALRLIPSLMLRLKDGLDPVLRSDGSAEFDFLYVDDAVQAFLCAAEHAEQAAGEIFNVGTGSPTSVLDVLRMAVQVSGHPSNDPQLRPACAPVTAERSWADIRKIQAMLGWTPTVGIEDGLRRTWSVYQTSEPGCLR